MSWKDSFAAGEHGPINPQPHFHPIAGHCMIFQRWRGSGTHSRAYIAIAMKEKTKQPVKTETLPLK